MKNHDIYAQEIHKKNIYNIVPRYLILTIYRSDVTSCSVVGGLTINTVGHFRIEEEPKLGASVDKDVLFNNAINAVSQAVLVSSQEAPLLYVFCWNKTVTFDS